MRAGALDHRISIQRSAGRDSAFGGQDGTWSTFAQVWAHVHDASGRAVQASGERQVLQTVVMTIRYLPGLAAGMRVLWAGRTLNITGLGMQGRRSWHVLQLSEENVTAGAE